MGSLRFCNILYVFLNKNIISSRHFSTGSSQLAVDKSFYKRAVIFNKLMGSTKKKRKYIFDEPKVTLTENNINLGAHLKNSKENSRRIAVLNSLFMKHISDLLVTGVGEDVLSKGLQISRVSMCPNFNQLNVYWGCLQEESIVELENILPSVGYNLRHELTQLNVVGIVPRISFIKDKHFSNGPKVDYLLKIADFGEDHVPVEFKSDFEPDPLAKSAEECVSGEAQSGTSASENDEADEPLPPMRHDVFNLDHQIIMQRILKRMQKSRAIHRFEPNLRIKTDGNISYSENEPDRELLTKDERKEAMAKFLISRRVLQEKKLKEKYKSDKEIFAEREVDNEENEYEDIEVEDYIDEDFEDKRYQY